METITLSAHYDGSQIQLDDPYELQPNTKLLVTIIQAVEPDDAAWRDVSLQGLEAAYSNVEPEYHPAGKKLAELPALFASLPSLSPLEATQFADDLAASQKALAQMEVHDPWRS